MAAHAKIMDRFKNAIFKQREVINDRITEMFGLLKELSASRTPEKVLIREEARHPITKNVNSISVIREEEEKDNNRAIIESIVEPSKSEEEEPPKKAFMTNEVERRADDKPTKNIRENVTNNEEEEAIRVSNSYRIAEDVLVDVVGYVYPVDFVQKVGAKKEIIKPWENLQFYGERIKNDIEPIAPMMTVNRLVLEWEEKIKLHQEKEMKFDQWRSKIFKNERPALVTMESEVADDDDVT
ncbi:hypothetical protein Tco_0751646 [Tanacetum coccineum]|uniref:Uncharacterized protein n=1 Tax=Tanacetum coccineum TaxID=301880 RepID=A0ABQ4Z7R5_9ASTR